MLMLHYNLQTSSEIVGQRHHSDSLAPASHPGFSKKRKFPHHRNANANTKPSIYLTTCAGSHHGTHEYVGHGGKMVVVLAVSHLLTTIGVLFAEVAVAGGSVLIIVTIVVFSTSRPRTRFSITGTGRFKSHATFPWGHLGGVQ